MDGHSCWWIRMVSLQEAMVENKSKCTEFYAIDWLVDGPLMAAVGYGDGAALGLFVVFVLQNTYRIRPNRRPGRLRKFVLYH